MVSVEELHVYPLKSARGIAKSTVRLTATGLEWDRTWMVTDCAGGFLTQRTLPNLARIETCLSAQLAPVAFPDGFPILVCNRAPVVRELGPWVVFTRP
jgi:MOSC domain-containing protein